VPIAREPGNRKIGGVVAGISTAYGFDRRTTRIAVAVGALVVPGIIALYIASMIFLPRLPEQPRTLREIFTERRRRPLLIVLGIAAIATGFGSWAFFGGLGWGFALVAAGVVLWLAPNFGSSVSTPTGSAAGQPWQGSAPTAPVRRRRYPIQAIALAAASIGALTVGIGNSADWWSVSIYGLVVGVLIALITATVVGVIVNRSWFGIPMLVMLGACTVGVVMTHPNLEGGIGDRTVRPTTVADAQTHQNLGIGRLTLYLTRIELG
jgi:phage shock protein PspC (stress-responsive transcriptional regulator)